MAQANQIINNNPANLAMAAAPVTTGFIGQGNVNIDPVTRLTAAEEVLLDPLEKRYVKESENNNKINIMAIEPKNTREHILSLYGHISGVKKNLKHVHEDVEKLGGKIDQIYWVLLTVAGTAVVFVLERMFG